MRSVAPSRISSGGYFLRTRASSGVNVDEDTALSYSAVFAAVKVISETVGMLPWRVTRLVGDKRESLSGSSLDVILHRKPNNEQTPFLFREYMLVCALLHGNGYAEIETNRAREPSALYPLAPDVVTPKRDDGRLVYLVRQERGGEVTIPAERMFHLRGPTKDGIVGRSVLSLARESWGLGIAAEQFAGAFFGNGAIPSLFIEQGDGAPNLSPEGASNMLASFERRHKGPGKAGKTAYLERGFKVTSVGIPQKDAQFLETKKATITDVARWFRIPPHKIGDLEKSAFSNIESQERNFVNDAIMPWLVRLEGEAYAKLVVDDAVSTKLDVRGLLRGTNIERADYYAKMRDLGVLSINEIRELEDLDPIEDGDLRLVPLNLVSVKRAAQSGGTDPASALRGVIVEAHERMIRKEMLAYTKARESAKAMETWAPDFWGRQRSQMVDAIMPGALALASTVGASADRVAGIVETHAGLHCEISLSAAASLSNLPHRAALQADRLIGLIVGASHA